MNLPNKLTMLRMVWQKTVLRKKQVCSKLVQQRPIAVLVV